MNSRRVPCLPWDNIKECLTAVPAWICALIRSPQRPPRQTPLNGYSAGSRKNNSPSKLDTAFVPSSGSRTRLEPIGRWSERERIIPLRRAVLVVRSSGSVADNTRYLEDGRHLTSGTLQLVADVMGFRQPKGVRKQRAQSRKSR